MKLALAALVMVGGAAAQSLPPETILVARIQDHLRAQLGRLPDYTCLENIVRYHREPARGAKLLPLDHMQLEVLFSGVQEWFGWPGSRILDEPDPARFIGGGMIGNGLFALFQKQLVSNATTYTWRGEQPAEGDGRRSVQYDFRVPRLLAGQRISLVTGFGTVGLKGSLWADPRTLEILRLTVEADEIPPSLPLAEMGARIDYAHTRIGAGDILLAQTADLHMRELSGEENYDRFEFTHCSQFHAESAVRFEAADSSAPAGVAAKTAGPSAAVEEKVPALLAVTVALETPISPSDPVGVPLEGRVVGDVLRKGKVAIPAGSLVRGRLRRLERTDVKPGYTVVGIEYTEIEIRGEPTLFYADVIRLDRRNGIQEALPSRIYRPNYPGLSHEAEQAIVLPEIPGVASFFVPGATLSLPKGFWTVWRTRGLLHQ